MFKRIISVLIALAAAGPALGDICKEEPPARIWDEAEAILGETYAAAVPGSTSNTGARRGYNAKLINCNRKRDSLGKKIEQEIKAKHTFNNNLQPRMVNGKYKYFGVYPLKYAYQLERKAGTWIVTVPIRFHWPTGRKTDRIDLPIEKAAELGLTAAGKVCAKGNTVYEDLGNRAVTAGYIGDASEMPSFVAKKDVMFYGGMASCRLSRTVLYSGKTVLNHLRDYWRDAIKDNWNRPGFEINPVFIDCENERGTQSCDRASSGDINIWEKSKVVWDVRFNLDPDHRPSYTRWLAKWNHMHTGVDAEVVAHELGHQMGLDDEYWLDDKLDNITGIDCRKEYADAGVHYLMCSHWAGANGAQAVYPWIITRRYAVAKLPACKTDGDCDGGEYCDKGWATIGRNECRAVHAYGTGCSRDAQCGAGHKCQGAPIGKCIKPASVAIGRTCIKDAECKSGSCDKDGRCQCTDDNQCDGNKYCDKGWATIGKNQCRAYHAYGSGCSRDEQCGSGKVCQGKPVGKCIKPASIAIGKACIKDAECTTGSCNKDGKCQCTSNGHCTGDQYCDKGTAGIGKNQCKAPHAYGSGCSADDQCGSGNVCQGKPVGKCIKPASVAIGKSCIKDNECTSGSCNKDGKCQCKKNSDCGGDKYCDTGTLGVGKNSCVKYKKKGDKCSANKQCKSPQKCKGVVGFKKCK